MANCPKEADEQKAFVEWYHRWAGDNMPPLMSIPNERKSSPANMNHLKKMGLWTGAPDIFIAWPRHGFHGIFIEMKAKKGRVSEAQKEAHERLRKSGYAVCVCFGADEAKALMANYALNIEGEGFVIKRGN